MSQSRAFDKPLAVMVQEHDARMAASEYLPNKMVGLPPDDEPPPHSDAELESVIDGVPYTDATPPLSDLSWVDPTEWDDVPVPERQWLVRNRIPAGAVTLLTGDGAAGKTTISLQLAVAAVMGADWLGALVDAPGAVDFMTAEEDRDEIHRRLDAILRARGLGFRDLDGGLGLHCCADEDAVLGTPERGGLIRPTPLFERIESALMARRPVLFIVEALADIYGGNENDRTQVRQFGGLLRRLALRSGAAVLVLGHPSLSGMSTGSGTSGSTHWNNTARSRLYFTAAKGLDDEAESDVRELVVMKANYGPSGEKVRVRWDNGVFAPVGSLSTVERAAAEAAVDHAFLRCLEVRTAQGIEVGPNTGRSYAPHSFEGMSEANDCRRKALAQAMERLLAAGKIRVEKSGPPSRARQVLVRVDGAA